MTDSNEVGKNSKYTLYLLVMLTLLDCRQKWYKESVEAFRDMHHLLPKTDQYSKAQAEWNAIKKDPERLNAPLLELKATAKVKKTKSQSNLVQSFLAKSKPAMPDVNIIECL